jgi:cytochrome c oxidase subunit I
VSPGSAVPEVVTAELGERRPRWIELATSADHKDVGVLYVGAALCFLVLALVSLLLIRLQLVVPENTLIDPEVFNRLLSTYGITAILLVGVPLALGLFSYVVPLQIGARGVALPHLNMLSFWLYLAGGVAIFASFLYTPPEAGTIPLPPLSDEGFSHTNGVDVWITGAGLAALGFTLFAINLVATLHRMRAPGMAWRRVPLFSWAATVCAYMLLMVGPVMLAALSMLAIDRSFDGVFFDPGEGGAPLLFQHMSYLFFTGAYFVILLCAFGAISEILPVFARKPIFNHRTVAGCLMAIGGLGLAAWMQNMYSAPIPAGWAYLAMAAAVLLLVPIGLLVFNWIATLVGGTLSLRAPALFALGAISTISIGATGELAKSLIPVGWKLGATTDAWADTHYVLIGGLMGIFAGLYYWYPKITGRTMHEGLARASFWITLLGAHLALAPLALAGLEGQPNDIYMYFDVGRLDTYNLIATVGAFVLAAGIVLTLVNAARSPRTGVPTGHDPWGGATLEWFALSPPPEHNFDLLPDVRSAEPLRDIREGVGRQTGG